MKPSFFKHWPFVLLLALVVVFLGDVWFGGKMLLLRDFFFTESQLRLLHGEALRHGSFGLWQNFQCGVPGAAQPYNAAFYPPQWLFVIPSEALAFRLWWTFHFILAAFGMYGLARHWRLAVAPALLAAVSFTFSTEVVAWVEGIQFPSMAWGPLVLLCVSRIIERTAERRELGGKALLAGNGGLIAALAGVVALQMLANGEHLYYAMLISGAYATARWFWFRSWKVCGYSLLCIVLAGGLSVALAMPQLILMQELVPLSDRTGEINAMLQIASVHPRQWLHLLLPFLYGKPGYPAAYWGPSLYEFAVGHCYLGIAPLVAACFGWLWIKGGQADRERRFQIGFLVALAAVGLIMAAGKYTPVYAFLHHWFPGLGHLRFAPKFYLFVAYAVAILGAIGFQALVESRGTSNPLQKTVWRVLAAFVALFFAGFLACVCSPEVLAWLMAHPTGASLQQMNEVLLDYAYAVVFSLAALGLFGMLVFQRGSSRWVQGGIVALAFLNLLVISRQVLQSLNENIYVKRSQGLAEKTKAHANERFLSLYYEAQQYFYGETRPEFYEWAIASGATYAPRLNGQLILTPGGMALNRYNQLFALLTSAPLPISNKIADMMSLRYVVGGAPFDRILWANASRDIQFIERSSSLPRATVVSRWRVVAGEKETLQAIVSDAFNPRVEALLEPLAGEQPSPSEAGDAQAEVHSFTDHTESVDVEVTTKARSLLVVSDAWYPGWIATVDGVQRPIFRTNYHFRGVFLEPGTHRVEFVYKPVRFTIGVWIFACAAAACVGLGWLAHSQAAPLEPKKDTRKRRADVRA